MGIIQYSTVLILKYDNLFFNKLYYVLLTLVIYDSNNIQSIDDLNFQIYKYTYFDLWLGNFSILLLN